MRHSLLRLLTECPKSCEPIDPRAIPHLKTFLELNISTQSQALRQAMFSSFKKLLQRAADSNIYWRKPGKKHEVYGEKGIEDVLRQEGWINRNFIYLEIIYRDQDKHLTLALLRFILRIGKERSWSPIFGFSASLNFILVVAFSLVRRP